MQLKVLNKEKTVHLVRDDALNRGNSQKDEKGIVTMLIYACQVNLYSLV